MKPIIVPIRPSLGVGPLRTVWTHADFQEFQRNAPVFELRLRFYFEQVSPVRIRERNKVFVFYC